MSRLLDIAEVVLVKSKFWIKLWITFGQQVKIGNLRVRDHVCVHRTNKTSEFLPAELSAGRRPFSPCDRGGVNERRGYLLAVLSQKVTKVLKHEL